MINKNTYYLSLIILFVCFTFANKEIITKSISEASPSQKVVKIYSEVIYGIQKKGSAWTLGLTGGGKEEIKSGVLKGAGFVVLSEDKPLIVTTAHIIRGPAAVKKVKGIKIDGDKAKIIYLKYRVRISTFSLRPDKIYLDKTNDIALIRITKDKLNMLNLETFELKTSTPKVEDSVRIWGFPGTPVPQLHDKAKITDVKSSYFSLNKPVDSGYSGGPVFSSKGELLGLVARSSKKQTRCINNSAVQKAVEMFNKNSVKYKDYLKIGK